MSDTRAAMKEFRFLDEKRRVGGLTAPEEQRWLDLRQQLGVTDAHDSTPAQDAWAQQQQQQQQQQQPQGYYGADGQWYAYPQDYYPQQGYPQSSEWPAEGQQGYDP